MRKITFLLLFISQISFSQTSAVGEVMEEIVWEQDSILSVYNWMAENIGQSLSRPKRDSDTKSKKKPKKRKGKKSSKRSKPKTPAQIADQKIKKIITRKKGSGLEIATLFNAFMTELGHESRVISGYMRNEGGKSPYRDHSWNAVKIDGAWKLYDAAWGAGQMDKRKFVKKYDAAWYGASATEMIKGHMPFDPAWQLLGTPVSYEDFDGMKAVKSDGGNFDYATMIMEHFSLDGKQQLQASLDRANGNGDGNEVVMAYKEKLAEKIENYDYDANVKLLEDTKMSYSDVGDQFELYKKAKKIKFKDKKWNRKKARKTLNHLQETLDSALNVYDGMEVGDEKLSKSVDKEFKFCDDFLAKVQEEIEYMDSLTPLKMQVGKR